MALSLDLTGVGYAFHMGVGWDDAVLRGLWRLRSKKKPNGRRERGASSCGILSSHHDSLPKEVVLPTFCSDERRSKQRKR